MLMTMAIAHSHNIVAVVAEIVFVHAFVVVGDDDIAAELLKVIGMMAVEGELDL